MQGEILMKLILYICFTFAFQKVSAQFYVWYPTSIKDKNVNLLRDTITYDEFGNKDYEVHIDSSGEAGLYTYYYSRKKKKKNPKVCTYVWYAIEKDTVRYTEEKAYDRERALRSHTIWSKKGDRAFVEYHYNSISLKLEFTWPEKVYDGTYQEFRGDGQIWFEGRYKKGFRVGKWTEYHPNGQKLMEGKYEKAYKTLHIQSHKDGWSHVIRDHNLDTLYQNIQRNYWSGHEWDDSLRSHYLMDNTFGNHKPFRYYNRHGKWRHYSNTGNLYLIEKWKHGICVDSVFVDTLK